MNTERKEMEKDNKKSFKDIIEAISEMDLKQHMYEEMPKDKLIDRLIMCEMELAAREEEAAEHSIELWYFVSDETGAKYLTDEKPKVYLSFGPAEESGSEVVPIKGNKVWFTDGEINIRVPVCMEKMFPEIKYGDDPIKVILSNITL